MRISIALIAAALVLAPLLAFAASTLPTEARAVIRQVREAAKAKDFQVLERLMVPQFVWSFGGDGDAQQAISNWKQHPHELKELHRATGMRCEAVEGTIVCPAHAGFGYHATFIKTADGWRMEAFVAGD